MFKSYYWLLEHARTILIVLGIILLTASSTLSEGRIKRLRDHSAYEKEVATLKVQAPISTKQKGTAGTKDLKVQLKNQQQTQDTLSDVHTNPYNDDKASKAHLLKQNQKVLTTSQKRLKIQQAVASAEQKALDAQIAKQHKLQAQREQQTAAAKKVMDQLFVGDVVTEGNMSKLNQGLQAYKQIPSNDSEHSHYAFIYKAIKTQIKIVEQMRKFQNEN
ncbi:hypothetical protein TEHD10_2226 [Tetragenococcus halophilus subsp. halophilus]|uniref:hypothetical protein n=1 Tax=Tetragenococcus halophilus TaxID=51669 RepID=UPI000CC872B0|nr:hypothetical protein [Tetragenococcus halophilus]GBD81163.1 hypothetical protein TEHD10_2226 [Tetragenococcus halophilus subsp. halophilus]